MNDAKNPLDYEQPTVMSNEEWDKWIENNIPPATAPPTPHDETDWYSNGSLRIGEEDAKDIIKAAMYGIASFADPSNPREYMHKILDARQAAIDAIEAHNESIDQLQQGLTEEQHQGDWIDQVHGVFDIPDNTENDQ